MCKQTQFLLLPDNIQAALRHVLHDEFVFQVASADVDGIMFMCGLAVVTSMCDGDICFSVIHDLFIIDGSLYLVVCKLEKHEYCRHFHLYCARPSTEFCAVRVLDFLDIQRWLSGHVQLCIFLLFI